MNINKVKVYYTTTLGCGFVVDNPRTFHITRGMHCIVGASVSEC